MGKLIIMRLSDSHILFDSFKKKTDIQNYLLYKFYLIKKINGISKFNCFKSIFKEKIFFLIGQKTIIIKISKHETALDVVASLKDILLKKIKSINIDNIDGIQISKFHVKEHKLNISKIRDDIKMNTGDIKNIVVLKDTKIIFNNYEKHFLKALYESVKKSNSHSQKFKCFSFFFKKIDNITICISYSNVIKDPEFYFDKFASILVEKMTLYGEESCANLAQEFLNDNFISKLMLEDAKSVKDIVENNLRELLINHEALSQLEKASISLNKASEKYKQVSLGTRRKMEFRRYLTYFIFIIIIISFIYLFI